MEDMFARHVLPALRPAGRGTVRTRALHTFGAGESAVAERLGDLLRRGRNPQVGTTVSKGIVTVRVRSEAATPAAAARALDETCRAVRQRLGVRVFGADEDTLEAVTGRLLRERGKTVALAESCTGGLVAKLLTDVAGASDYFLGGWVAYANLLKQRELGVRAKTLAAHGAVSEAVAREMAEGALQRAGANLALSLTGIAGPAGGTEEKPVGTVWIALARREGSRSQSSAQSFRFAGDRESVRERAARTALNMLRLYLLETPA
jgi:nicotinamide-nucleotide amidase